MDNKIYRFLKYIYQVYLTKTKLSKKQKNQFNKFASDAEIIKPFIWVGDKKGFSIGRGSVVLSHSRLQIHPSLDNKNPSISIGNRCFLGYYLTILAGEDIYIGNDVLMASNILITSENHGSNPESKTPYMDQPLNGKKVFIEDGCWIGEKVVILPGVKIGKKCIIGAGSIVTKSIPDYSIAVGNPARVIKKYDFDLHEWVSAER